MKKGGCDLAVLYFDFLRPLAPFIPKVASVHTSLIAALQFAVWLDSFIQSCVCVPRYFSSEKGELVVEKRTVMNIYLRFPGLANS